MTENLDLSLATRPSNLTAVDGLILDINDLQKKLVEGDEETRHELVIKTRSLLQSLQTPPLITGVDTGLWKLMAQNGVNQPQKVGALAETLRVDPVLLGRLLRHVCAMGHLKETAQDEYILTNFTKSLALDVIGDGYVALHENMFTDDDFTVGGYRQGRVPWMHPSLYPVEKTLFSGADTSPDAPLLVDVAGGLGHDIDEFKKMYPNHPGKLILQDLPVVINDVKGIDTSIELMGHDFLTEQPIKGAKAYFMHSIMHDWPDDVCKKILAPLAEAMKPGYSKLLIFEVVIPRTGAYWEATAGDILMMTQLSALERTEDHWHQLIEESGLNLRIVNFWKCGQSDVENLIECELVA
ncbi:uncharacterized protein N0V96_008670 [Colletotrichum fioriniae]|uniref:uncharacterized protein n=1 Tax=Colletotrichum fioriniae TaxID=710243 RepID=UPI0032DBC6CD|nr:hypothetical protein N0V96_008670 [Colletotrichum fioriniae]